MGLIIIPGGGEHAADQDHGERERNKSSNVHVAWIEALPRLLLVGLLIVLVLIYSKEIKAFLSRTNELSFGGVSIKADLSELKQQAESGPNPQELDVIGSRLAVLWARSAGRYYQDAELLWVDDHPENNIPFRNVIARYGAKVILATSTREALAAVKKHEFDIIISDIKRDDVTDLSGIDFLSEVRKFTHAPVIFYVLQTKETPISGTFAVEASPDKLLLSLSDALMTYRNVR